MHVIKPFIEIGPKCNVGNLLNSNLHNPIHISTQED